MSVFCSLQMALLCAIAIACGCDDRARALNAPTTAQVAKLDWDLTAGLAPQNIGWPETVSDTQWFIEQPTQVAVRLPDGKESLLSIRSAILFREGDRLTSLYFFFEPENAEQSLNRALTLCKEFGIEDVGPLHKWAQNPRMDLGNKQGERWIQVYGPKGKLQRVFVEIRPSFNPRTPWQVRLCFGFNDANRASATKPSATTRQAASMPASTRSAS
jgi:hypothetical protein